MSIFTSGIHDSQKDWYLTNTIIKIWIKPKVTFCYTDRVQIDLFIIVMLYYYVVAGTSLRTRVVFPYRWLVRMKARRIWSAGKAWKSLKHRAPRSADVPPLSLRIYRYIAQDSRQDAQSNATVLDVQRERNQARMQVDQKALFRLCLASWWAQWRISAPTQD